MASAHDKLVGRSLGEFVLRERLGEGGFGAVYRAIQPALDRDAVIKVLHARLHASKAAAERFLREAKLASKLDHPYAAHIYGFGTEPDGELWIAMELVRGTPLDKVLKLQGPLTLERFVPLLDRICEVVHTAHEQGIIHRDLKPANVMVLARAGRLLPKLLDFGIAKGLAEPSIATDETQAGEAGPVGFADTLDTPVHGLTQRGAIMGSPPYMAPEQWMDAGQVDARTDLYALGILAYECLTGKPPFLGPTITAIAMAHADEAPAPLGPRFPSALDKVLAKALAKAPEDRYADALALAAAVRAASGIASEPIKLPAIDLAQRDAAVTGAPQPIAEALAAFEAARNVYQARDALALVGRTLARYLGLLVLACRSRVSGDDEASEAIRTLYRRSLTDKEWIELARQLTRTWTSRRDAYPIPELVGVFHDGHVVEQLAALAALRDAEAVTDDTVLALVEGAVVQVSQLLEALAFLRDYPLVVTTAGGYAERWMGVRRAQRSTIAVRGKGLAAGAPALLDRDGVPVLSLAPLFQVGAPSPGAPLDLFLFEGRDRRGAKLVSLPSGFEHHDDELWDWLRTQLVGSLDEADAAVAEEKPPYRGLSAFSADDTALFVGREKLVDAFANRLKLQPLLVVVGQSGTGKSSFVHAGVVPALSGWRALTLRPGASPLGSLVAKLEHAGIVDAPERTPEQSGSAFSASANLGGLISSDRDALGNLLRADAVRRGPLLVVVDQLEEMFTLCQDADERRIFAEALASAARTADDPVRVVFTLRDDFLVRTEQVAALRNRIGQGLQILTVPAAEDLLRIVTEPARRVGYELEGDLAAQMVKEVADQPGALALISFTASKLWELRDRHFKQLTRSAYKTLGGVGGALARHAEQTLDAMPPEERALTREAFRHLVTSQNTRAIVPHKELRQLLGNTPHAAGVIEKLVAARLLVAAENETGAETIEVIHEALLVTWPRLVEWRREDSEGTRFREQLRSAAKQWDERGRAKGLLWRGDALGELTRWRGRHTGPLTDLEGAFTDASLADVARSRRNTRIVLATAFAVLGAALVSLVWLNTRVTGQRAQLHDNLQHQYESQGRTMVLRGDPRALAYLMKAREGGAHGPAHDLLVAEAVAAESGELVELHHDGAVRAPHFSNDGTRLITGGFDRHARIWDVKTGAELASIAHPDTVGRAIFSPDDTLVLTASVDGLVRLSDARTGALVREFQHTAAVWCAVFTPDGTAIITGGADDVMVVRSIGDGSTRVTVHGSGAGFSTCALAPDGSTFAAGDTTGVTRIWNIQGALLHELHQHERVHTLAFSPSGASVVSSSADGTAVSWTVATGQQERVFTHVAGVSSAEFSSDGALVVTASRDRTAVVWDAHSGAKVMTLAGHAGGVKRAVFSPDGRHVVTASEDATAWLWDVATGSVEARWRGHEEVVFDLAYDRTGARLVTASDDGRAIIWSPVPQESVLWLAGHSRAVGDARFSSDGAHVVTASDDGTARVWDATTGRELQQIQGSFSAAAFSPDGQTIATTGADGMLRFWDARSGVPRGEPLVVTATRDPLVVMAWSRDGTSLATATQDGLLRCWDAATRALRFENRGHDGRGIYSVGFDPAGTSLVTTGDDKVMRIWDLHGTLRAQLVDLDGPTDAAFNSDGTQIVEIVARQKVKVWTPATGIIGPILAGHVGLITYARWSPDDQFIVTGARDATARLWDARTGSMLAIYSHPGLVHVAAFSPDGTKLMIAGEDGRVALHALPRLTSDELELARFFRCRSPFDVVGGEAEPRPRAWVGCDRLPPQGSKAVGDWNGALVR